MTNSYKIYCKELDEIISVKILAPEEELVLYEEIKERFSSTPDSINVSEYKKSIVDLFLLDAQAFYIGEDDYKKTGVFEDLISVLYKTIVEAYPHFEFEFICFDINASLAVNNANKLFEKYVNKTQLKTASVAQKAYSLSTLADIQRIEKSLSSSVVGQDVAIKDIVSSLKLLATGLQKFSSFFFIGPTGVGKTKLAKELGSEYSGNFFKINCGEYSSAHDYAKLIGAPPGYVGHTDSSLLAEKAEVSNKWIILFDEIEKAHPKFYDFLLSLLDDGTVTDNMGRVLDFSQSMFIFTSNQGLNESKLNRKMVGFDKTPNTYDQTKEQVLESVKKNFNPEFLNRLDHFIFFNELSAEDLRTIAKMELSDIPIRKTKKLLDYIIKNGYSKEYGARNINRFIRNNVSVKVADALLENRVPTSSGTLYSSKVVNNELFIINTKEF
tara:strand:+ start:3564 stop:4883 length:1320 start_codon:yes stop_codon:yes gene_type:complete